MKISSIFVCLTLSTIIEGNMLTAAIRGIEPIILSCGAAAFAALGLNSLPMFDSSDSSDSLNKHIYPYTRKYNPKPKT